MEAHGAVDQLGHLLGAERFGVQHQVEQLGGGAGLAELGFAVGAVGSFQLEQQFARGGAFQAAIQHEVADAHVFRRHHVDAQHAGEMLRLELAAGGAVHKVVLGGQTRQDRKSARLA